MKKTLFISLGLLALLYVPTFGAKVPTPNVPKQATDTVVSATRQATSTTSTENNPVKEIKQATDPVVPVTRHATTATSFENKSSKEIRSPEFNPKDYLNVTLEQQWRVIDSFRWGIGIIITTILAIYGLFGFQRIKSFEKEADRSLKYYKNKFNDMFTKIEAEYRKKRTSKETAETIAKITAETIAEITSEKPPKLEKEIDKSINNVVEGKTTPTEEVTRLLGLPDDDAKKTSNDFLIRGDLEPDLKKKEMYYKKATEKDPQNALAFHNLGWVYNQFKDYEEAIYNFSQAERIEPSFWPIYLNRGIAYLEKGYLNQAEKDFRKAKDLNPASPMPYNNLGLCFSKDKAYIKAIQFFSLALIQNPNHLPALSNRGGAYTELPDHYEDALKDFDQIISLAPDDPKAYHFKAIVYAKRKAPEDIVKMLDCLEKAESKGFRNIERFNENRKDYDELIKDHPEHKKRFEDVVKKITAAANEM